MFAIRRLAATGIVVVVLAATFGACSNNAVVPTQAPAASQTPADQPTDTPTPEVTPTPTATATVAEASAIVTPAPTATPTPAPSETPTPSAAASSVASACTGTAEHQAFFVEAANKLPFDVYCAALPAGWFFQDAAYAQANGGKLTIDYKGPGGATLAISEGAFCTVSVAACSPHASIRGTASFGDKPGMLDVLTTPPDVLVVYVSPGTKAAYQISGTNLTQARFVALAAVMTKVPKS
jgi:hypothetical protein